MRSHTLTALRAATSLQGTGMTEQKYETLDPAFCVVQPFEMGNFDPRNEY